MLTQGRFLFRKRVCDIDSRELLGAGIYLLAHGCSYSALENQFGISSSYLNMNMKHILGGIIETLMSDTFGYMRLPQTVLEAEAESAKWSENGLGRFRFLRKCISAADGSLVPVIFKKDFHPERWRCRKGFTCQNVLAFADFNRCFQAFWDGGDGCASDSSLIQWSSCESKILDGYFALFDAGGMMSTKLVLPYRNTRYHLNEWSGIRPANKEELFNLRHSARRSRAIECAFGMWKARWRILRVGIVGNLEAVRLITRATAFLHNFCTRRRADTLYDLHSSMISEESSHATLTQDDVVPSSQRLSEGKSFRDDLASDAWENFTSSNTDNISNEIINHQVASYCNGSTPHKRFFQ